MSGSEAGPVAEPTAFPARDESMPAAAPARVGPPGGSTPLHEESHVRT